MTLPKLLLVTHELSRTGAPRIAVDVVEACRGAYDIRIVAYRGGGLKERAARLAPTFSLDMHYQASGFHRLWLQSLRQMHLESARRWRPDVIYVNSVASLKLLKILRYVDEQPPVLLHVHELESILDVAAATYGQLLFRRPQRYIAVADAVREALVARGVDAGKIRRVYEFAPAGLLDRPLPAKKNPGDAIVIGGSGNISWRKGATLWLQTMAELKRLRPGVRFEFTWVGDADERGMDVRPRKLGIGQEVRVLGEVADPFAEYARFDMLMMSSWEDPCPLVVLEAMALGKPVVCFANSGGAREQVGPTGVVVDEFSPTRAAEALCRLVDDPDLRERLGNAARQRVREQFTDVVQIPKIRAEIDALLGSSLRRLNEPTPANEPSADAAG